MGLGALDAPVVITVAGLVLVGNIGRQTMYIITARIGPSACAKWGVELVVLAFVSEVIFIGLGGGGVVGAP